MPPTRNLALPRLGRAARHNRACRVPRLATSAERLPTDRLAVDELEGWSGRRGSNPRPTAWKAVTLPLSYSRLRSLLPAGPPSLLELRGGMRQHSFAQPLRGTSRRHSRSPRTRHPAGRVRRSRVVVISGLASRSPPSRGALWAGGRLVAREGFEPSKALGRQIYSLLRLTAPQPRRTTDRA